MHKVEILEKHCTTSKEGVIALSNTFVETAVKIHNCPIKVTCADYPGEESIYSVDELLIPKFTAGPYQNRFGPGEDTYTLYMYAWKGTPISMDYSNKEKWATETVLTTTEVVVERRGRGYVIKTPVVVTTFEEKEVSLSEYVGMILHQTRSSRGLTQAQLSNLTNGKVSATSISQIETATTNPILSSLEHISEALGLHISDLFPPKTKADESKN
jgi:DNA-binding XRE family transcriptional regulator